MTSSEVDVLKEELLLKNAELANVVLTKDTEIIDLTAKYEEQLVDSDASWKARMETAVKSCQEKLQLTHVTTLEQTKQTHMQQLRECEAAAEAYIKRLSQALDEKEAKLEDQEVALKKLTQEGKQHLEVMEDLKKHHQDQLKQLKDTVSVQEKVIKEDERVQHAAAISLRESQEEVRRKELQWVEEKTEIIMMARAEKQQLQEDITLLQNDIATSRFNCSSVIEDSIRNIQTERKQAQEARRKIEEDFRQHEVKLQEALQAQQDTVAKSENKNRDLLEKLKTMEEKHDIERTRAEEHLKESKVKLRDNLEASFNRRERSSKSLADVHKEHALNMLRREMELEVNKEKRSRVVVEQQLNSLKEQHKQETELLQTQIAADLERAERKHETELAKKEEYMKKQLEMVREEKREVEESFYAEQTLLVQKLAIKEDKQTGELEGMATEHVQKQQDHKREKEEVKARGKKDLDTLRGKHDEEMELKEPITRQDLESDNANEALNCLAQDDHVCDQIGNSSATIYPSDNRNFIYHNNAMEWKCEDHNFSMIFQSDSLPTGTTESIVEISVTPGEDYLLPEPCIPVSSFFSINCQHKFHKNVSVSIEHCSAETSDLSFVVSCSSNPPFQFELLGGGVFYKRYGIIERKEFSIFGIVTRIRTGRWPHMMYYCALYISPPDDFTWRVYIYIAKDSATNRNAIEKDPKNEMTKLEAYTVATANHTVDNFTLDISLNEEEIAQGWKLPGNINPITIPRRRIDRCRGVPTPANFKIILDESKISSSSRFVHSYRIAEVNQENSLTLTVPAQIPARQESEQSVSNPLPLLDLNELQRHKSMLVTAFTFDCNWLASEFFAIGMLSSQHCDSILTIKPALTENEKAEIIVSGIMAKLHLDPSNLRNIVELLKKKASLFREAIAILEAFI